MARSTPYNLPAAWDPGYALPAYVEAEGLGRGAMVTKWQPRGSYGPGVVDYLARPMATVVDEIKQRGRAPAFQIATLGDVATPAGHDPVAAYGRKAARAIMASVARLPAQDRVRAMRIILDEIDPKLWTRAEQRARAAHAQGLAPAAALERGLASSMSDGVVEELIEVGKTRTAPPLASLIGLSCYGCAAVLGDVAERVVRDQRGTDTSTGTRTEDGGTGRVTGVVHEMAAVGPFSFPAVGGRIRVHRDQIPARWRTWLQAEARRLTGEIATTASSSKVAAMSPMVAARGVKLVKASSLGLDSFIGLPPDLGVSANYFNGTAPIMKVTHAGAEWGVFLISSPGFFEAYFRPVPKDERSWLGKAWDAVKSVGKAVVKAGGKVYDAAKDALGAVKNLGCNLVNAVATPGAVAAAAGASGGAAAAGVAITQGLCNGEQKSDEPALPPPAAQSGGGSIMPLAIGGAAVAALLLLK